MAWFVDSRLRDYGILLAVGAWMFLTNLGGASLWDVDEGRNATAALEMFESGNYIVPTFNAKLRVDKPALLYWLQVTAYRLFGVSEFSARLPSALAALLVLVFCYELARAMFNSITGLLAGLVVAGTPMLCGAARFANPDSLLNCCTLLTLLTFWLGYEKPRAWWFVALGTTSGLAVLAKGPVGIVLPGSIMFLFLIWEQRLRSVLRPGLLLALLVWFVVVVPWYLWVALDTKADFLRGFLMNHNVNRFLSPMENHHGSALYYPLVLLVGFGPWSLFLGLAGWYGGWSIARQPWTRFAGTWQSSADRDANAAAAYRFQTVWIGVYLVFFSMAATKLPNYILPVVAPCAILTARFLDRWRRGVIVPSALLLRGVLLSLAVIGVGTIFGLLIVSGVWPASVMRGRYFPGLEGWAAMGLVPIVAGIAGWWCLRTHHRSGVIASVMLGVLVFLGPLAAWASQSLNRFKATPALAAGRGLLRTDCDLRVGAWQAEYLPSLNFYARRDITHCSDEESALAFLRYPIPTYLVVPEKLWTEIEPRSPAGCVLLVRHDDLYRHQSIVLIANPTAAQPDR